MYAKIENGIVHTNIGNFLFNCSESVLTALNFKKVVKSTMPEVPDGYEAKQVFTDNGDTISLTWELVEKEPTLEDRVSAVEEAIIEIAEEVANG